jgi:sigma-70-like protein
VSADSDGPVEWCKPVPAAEAEGLAAQFPELTLRVQPAHREAYVDLGPAGQLTPPHREVLGLVFGSGLRLPEVAGVLEIPVGTVKSRLTAARSGRPTGHSST